MINPLRGEVWSVNMQPQVGDEMGKTRPAVVLSADGITRLELRIIVPITDWKSAYERHFTKVEIQPTPRNGLTKPSAADAYQIKSVSLNRFVAPQPLGRLTATEIEDICIALKIATAMM